VEWTGGRRAAAVGILVVGSGGGCSSFAAAPTANPTLTEDGGASPDGAPALVPALPGLPSCASGALLDLPPETFAGGPGKWTPAVKGDASVVRTDGGELSGTILLPAGGYAHYVRSWTGSASSASVRFRMRIDGTAPAGHVGCKLILGKLDAAHVNTRIQIAEDQLRLGLETEAPPARGTTAATKDLGRTPSQMVWFALDLTSGADGFRSRVTVADDTGVVRVAETGPVVWEGSSAEGALRCGVLETQGANGKTGQLTVIVDDVSAIICGK
jgi:hypothetical protein